MDQNKEMVNTMIISKFHIMKENGKMIKNMERAITNSKTTSSKAFSRRITSKDLVFSSSKMVIDILAILVMASLQEKENMFGRTAHFILVTSKMVFDKVWVNGNLEPITTNFILENS
jgi:hypothetical protein